MKFNHRFSFATAVLACSLYSCGKDKSDDSAPSCPSTPPSKDGGYALCLGSATTSAIELTGGSGQQYIVAPYTLGNHTSVTGAGATNLVFKLTATSASLQELRKNDEMNLRGIQPSSGETMRMIVNRFDSRKGLKQDQWIWNSLTALDAARANQIKRGEQVPSLKAHYQSLAMSSDGAEMAAVPLTLGNCPTSIPKVNNTATTFSVSSSYDGTSFCIAYASDPLSDTKTNIQASVATILSQYKDKIYGDQFTANVTNGYSFNPVIVVVDPTSTSMWPSGAAYKFTGAFSRDATTALKRPVIYLMDDMTAVQSGIDTTKATRLVHATLAHEMQHAIMDYYRMRGGVSAEETVAIDEGIAHTFEDAFGYGADNFTTYVQPFLSSVPDGAPVMVTGDGYNVAAARGGANSFLYFLAQRAGGFTVTDNRPFSGGGMTAITKLVKQTSATGPNGLKSAFGLSDLSEQVGQFFGALFSDNLSFSFAPAAFGVANYTGIANLQGNTDKTFGIRYNNFGGFTTVNSNSLSDAAAGIELKHYGAYPVLVTTTAATATVTVTLPTSENNGVAVIRVK